MISTVHGTAVTYDGRGLLIRGPSGSGKSSLALALLFDAPTRGKQSFLIADDRVHLKAEDDGIFASAPPRLSGLIEVHGYGIVSCQCIPHHRIDLVIDLGIMQAPFRHPDEIDHQVFLIGHRLRRINLARTSAIALPTVLAALGIMPILNDGKLEETWREPD